MKTKQKTITQVSGCVVGKATTINRFCDGETGICLSAEYKKRGGNGLYEAAGIKTKRKLRTDDFQAIVDVTIDFLGLELRVSVFMLDIPRGVALFCTPTPTILLPAWIREYHAAYQVDYVVHELGHFVSGTAGHSRVFKAVEDCLLCLWGLDIKRMSVYPKGLLKNGKPIKDIPHPG